MTHDTTSSTPSAETFSSMPQIDSATVVLGIETSCDETAAAVVMGGTDVLSSVVSSQLDVHARFGGVVPEIASRAHVESIPHVVAEALERANIDLDRVDAVAATVGPGLVGALLVGVSAAKATALALEVPFIGVNHLEAHLYAALLDEPRAEFPMLFVLVSGGHTLFVEMVDHDSYRVIGQTIDDAAGEAFDKVARFLHLSYPGGPAIDKAATRGNDTAVAIPRAMLNDGFDVSFSGVKTAVINYVRANPTVSSDDVAASFQRAVVDVLVHKSRRAARHVNARTIALGGGVAANSLLRSEMTKAAESEGVSLVLPSREMCTDNAAMIASAGWYRLRRGESTALDAGANPNLKLGSGQR